MINPSEPEQQHRMIPINRVTACLMRMKEEVEKLDMKGKTRWVWQMQRKNHHAELLNIKTLWECLEKSET